MTGKGEQNDPNAESSLGPDQCVIPNGPNAGQYVNSGASACFTATGSVEPTIHVCVGDNQWKDDRVQCVPTEGESAAAGMGPSQCVVPSGPQSGTIVNLGDSACFTGQGNVEPTIHVCGGNNVWKDDGVQCDPTQGTEG